MIWFDLDNSPHVLLFRPIFKELNRRNIDYFITARDFAQTKGLLDFYNLEYTLIGVHAGKSKIKKLLNLLVRAWKLKNYVKGKNVSLAISHGSRTQLLASKYLRIKSLLMFDYEYTESKIFNLLSTYMLAPKFIPDERLLIAKFNINKLIRYNGFKEELYISEFKPELNFRNRLNISNRSYLVVLRPPSMIGNYHDSRSESLLISTVNYLLNIKEVIIIIVNRTKTEKEYLEKHIKFNNNIRLLEKSVDGLQLLYAADCTISGGGTMNRESALLGTKTYSIFTGKKPYLDEYLQSLGRLKFIQNKNDIKKIEIKKTQRKEIIRHSSHLVEEVTDIITNYLK